MAPVAWDLAYLTVPWPSCWCAWQIPAAVGARALDAYGKVEPDLIARASTGWAFLSASWFLPRDLAGDPPSPAPDRPRPSLRAIVLDRFGRAGSEATPLSDLAGRLHEVLLDRWGPMPLEPAPAFRAGRPAAGRAG